jgi:GntR family transcriptional regulator of vanillate catabolism
MNRASAPEMAVPRPAARATVVTLAQTVTEQLRQALIDGRFVPDEKLNEESLSAMLKVSRTPVRAALHALAGEGLLDYVPNRGYSVRGLDLARLGGIFDVRGVLEGLAARQAAERGLDEPRRHAMRAALDEGDRVIGKGRLLVADRAVFSDVNACIHDTLLDAAANRMLLDMVRQCHNIPVSSERNVLWNDYRWLRRSHDDHHRLFEAVCSRDGARAEALMREHILSVKLQLVSQRS